MIGNAIAGLYGGGVPPVTTAYESIATTTVGAGGSSSITFSSIPSTFKHLQVRQIARTTLTAAIQTGNGIRFNSDSGTNYAVHILTGDGSSATANSFTNSDYIYYSSNTGSNAGTGTFGLAVIDILDYENTNKFKTIRLLAGADNNGSGNIAFRSGLWRSTSAINSITFDCRDGGSFVQYSQFALYGIKGA